MGHVPIMLRFAHGPPTIRLGDREVSRLGFGALRLAGPDGWGEPSDPAAARAVVRRAIELGVSLIDSAAAYGPGVSHRVIVEALHPYPSDLVIATQVGVRRGDDRSWHPALRPDDLVAQVEADLTALRLDALHLVQLRWAEQDEVSFDEALDALIALQAAGKVRAIGLANITVEQLAAALAKTPIACVHNRFALTGMGEPDGGPAAEEKPAPVVDEGSEDPAADSDEAAAKDAGPSDAARSKKGTDVEAAEQGAGKAEADAESAGPDEQSKPDDDKAEKPAASTRKPLPGNPVLAACEAAGIAFLPLLPLPLGELAATSGALAAAARRHNTRPVPLSIAWLLARSPVMLPVPSTSKIVHLEENCAAVHLPLEADAAHEPAPNR